MLELGSRLSSPVVLVATFQVNSLERRTFMSDFAQLLQGLAVLLIVSGAFALLLQRIFLSIKGSSTTGCSSGCSSCPSRCSQPRDANDQDSTTFIPLSEIRKL